MNQAENTLEVKRVGAICADLHRAYRDLRFYPPEHPVPRETMHQLVGLLRRFVAEEGRLTLEVEEDRLIFDEEPVYTHFETRDNLAFIMFRDGVRAVSLHSGLEAEEIEALVECLARADDMAGSDQDLLTALWEKDFTHIDYQAADPFVGGGVLRQGTLDALRETVLRRLDEVDLAQAAFGQEAAERLSIVPHLGTRPQDLELTPQELAESEQRVEGTASALDDFALVLLEMLSDPQEQARFGGVLARSMAAVVESYLKTGSLDELCFFLGHVQELEESDRCAPGVAERLVKTAISTHELGDLICNRGHVQDARLEQFLTLLRSRNCPALFELLAGSEDRSVRKTLLGFLERTGGMPGPQLAHMLADPRWYVARNALHLSAVSHDAGLIPAVERLATHPDARVRREAVRALDMLAGAAALPTFTRALADPDSAVRIAAAHSAVHFGGPEQEAAVRRQVDSHDFAGRPAEEMEAMLLALAHLGGERAVPVLCKLWHRRLFHPTPLAGRSAAVIALGAIPTPSARKILTDALRAREPAVRRAAEKALSERSHET